ncbi:MAG: LysR family transcriptional regulator [Lachnospiraceae bacterium]|nr:LysR family transcriptional regulator [Lachnospiraceae bacterium]
MTTQQISYFLKLAEELNYTSVARSFFITQPTLSKQIVNLENELGVTLFTRDHNSVKLTPAGKRFYDRMKPVFMDLMDAIRDAQSYEDKREIFTIGIQEEQLISNPFTLAINDLRREYPNLSVTIHRANLDELMEGLEKGEFDVLNIIGNLLPESVYSGMDRFSFMELENECYYLAFSRNLIDLPEEITKEELADVLSEHDLIFPILRHAISNEEAKAFFLDSMSDIDVSRINIKVTQSGRPISLPAQVSSQLGVTLCNQTNLFSIDPEIRLAKVLHTDGAYRKGLLWKKQSYNPYVQILLKMVEQQVKRREK